jgi:hypothetical protein
MAPHKRLPPDAEQVAVYLTPAEQLVLQTIRARRKDRAEERTSQSEVVVDVLWAYLEEIEGISRDEVLSLIKRPPRRVTAKIRVVPKTERT